MDRRCFLSGLGSVTAAGVGSRAAAQEQPVSTGEPLRDGRLAVSVWLNGAGPFSMVVDTAANMSMISDRVVDLLGLSEVDRIVMNTVAGAEPAGRVRIDSVQAGGLSRRNVRLPVGTAAGLGADGLLGGDLLRDHRAVFQFHPRRSVAIEPSRDERTGLFTGRRRIRASRSIERRRGGLVIVDGAVGGRRFQAILDSGAARTVINRALARAGRAIPDAAVAASEIRSPTGLSVAAVPMIMPAVGLDGFRLGRLPVDVAELHTFGLFGEAAAPMMLLGMDAFQKFDRLVVDFRRRQLIVDV